MKKLFKIYVAPLILSIILVTVCYFNNSFYYGLVGYSLYTCISHTTINLKHKPFGYMVCSFLVYIFVIVLAPVGIPLLIGIYFYNQQKEYEMYHSYYMMMSEEERSEISEKEFIEKSKAIIEALKNQY